MITCSNNLQIGNVSTDQSLENSLTEIQKLNFLSLQQSEYLSPQYIVNIEEVLRSLLDDTKVNYAYGTNSNSALTLAKC